MVCVLFGPGSDSGWRGRPLRTGRRDKPIIQLPSIALRVAIMVGIGVVLFGIVLFRLWFLQILNSQSYVALANDNRLRSLTIEAPRGNIVDRNDKVIVQNRPGIAVGIRLMDVPAGQLNSEVTRLASVLHVQPGLIHQRVKQHLQPSWPVADGPLTWAKIVAGKAISLDLTVVKDDVNFKVYSYILEHQATFPGVEIQKDYLRAYPMGDLAAQIVGNVGEISASELKQKHFKGYAAGDVVGQDGLEWTYDHWLRGTDGIVNIEVNAQGEPKSQDPVPGGQLAQPGDTLVTTLDAKVQAQAEKALTYGIGLARHDGEVDANGGAAVVLNARNGQVVAMASNPTFNPSIFVGGLSTKDYKALERTSANYPLLDRPIQEALATGSTFKPVTAIAALEEGVITPSTVLYCPGVYKKAGQVFHDWNPNGHGNIDLTQAITQSADTYFYQVGYKFYLRPGSDLQDWAQRLGLGGLTGIDLPGEVSGRVPTKQWKQSYFKTAVDKIWEPGDSIQLAVGQGYFEATPLQLATAYAAIANGGTIVQPHLGLKIVSAQGQTLRNLEPGNVRKVDISQGTLDVVRQALRDAASLPGGTSAPVFASYPIAVAGKTGTAEVYDASRKANVNYAWYASFAPASDPKYVVVVMIERGGHGATSAAPAARMIYDQLFGVKSTQFSGVVPGD